MDAYECKASDEDSMEQLAKKLTDDNDFAPLTEDWMNMTDSLARIANITEMEKKLPKDNEDATLWDCEELALRYILEDGKLNLCLRNLEEYHEFKRSRGSGIESANQEYMLKFETSMGLILKNAWAHVEAIQTTDLPLLVQYMARIVTDASGLPDQLDELQQLGNRAEAMVIHYLHGICKRLDEVDEGRVMPFLMENGILPKFATHLHLYHTKLSEEDLTKGAQALAVICDSEDFGMHPEQYVDSDEARRALVFLKDDFLAELVSDDLDIRRSCRPLLDQIDKAERDLPSK